MTSYRIRTVEVAVLTVRGRVFVVTRSAGEGQAADPSYDVRDQRTGLCLTPNQLREQPDAGRVAELLDELAAEFATGDTLGLWNHDDHFAIEEVVSGTRVAGSSGFWGGDRPAGDVDPRPYVMIGFGRHRSYYRFEGPELVGTGEELAFGCPDWGHAGSVDVGRDPGSLDESLATMALLHAVKACIDRVTENR